MVTILHRLALLAVVLLSFGLGGCIHTGEYYGPAPRNQVVDADIDAYGDGNYGAYRLRATHKQAAMLNVLEQNRAIAFDLRMAGTACQKDGDALLVVTYPGNEYYPGGSAKACVDRWTSEPHSLDDQIVPSDAFAAYGPGLVRVRALNIHLKAIYVYITHNELEQQRNMKRLNKFYGCPRGFVTAQATIFGTASRSNPVGTKGPICLSGETY